MVYYETLTKIKQDTNKWEIHPMSMSNIKGLICYINNVYNTPNYLHIQCNPHQILKTFL